MARLTYRSIGSSLGEWPAWIRALKTSSGVYAIRDRHTGRVLYVGSSGGRLYDTITRHFQQWHRTKNWWKGMYGAGHDPGLVYLRERCDVAVIVTAKGDHLTAEAQLISRLQPRDNLVEHPDGEEIPF